MQSEISRTVTFKLDEEEQFTVNNFVISEIRVLIDELPEDDPEVDYVDVEFCGRPANKDGSPRKSSSRRKIWPGVELHNKWEALGRKELAGK